MLMSLDDFIFELGTLAPHEVNNTLSVSWQKQARFQGRPAVQFTGIEGETLSMSGVLYPTSQITGTAQDLGRIKDMAVSGDSYVLVGSDGYFNGEFAILSITEKHTVLDKLGRAQKIEFEIQLERTDDDRVARLPQNGTGA